jgi:haloacid dehalogenase-like hydrolase
MLEDRVATTCNMTVIGQSAALSGANASPSGVKSFDASPDDAIAALMTHEGAVYVDLDETLYLRNSTEDYIDSAQPGVVAIVLLQLLEFLRPWKWTGGHPTRDVWRVWLVRTCFPWVRVRWRSRVGALAAQFVNARLAAALQQHRTRVVIVTVGFMPIVRPLIEALGFGDCRIIAARLGLQDRRNGKLQLVRAALGDEALSTALFITDSIDDAPVLARCQRPLRVVWPGSLYLRALSRVYLPGLYLSLVKRPGQRYIVRSVIQEDFAYWVLGTLALAPHPALHLCGLALMSMSLWSIYERGYANNDWAAANFESAGTLSSEFSRGSVVTPRFQPWLWAAASGAGAVYLLGPWPDFAANCAKWAAVLLATHLIFGTYNRMDKSTRIWIYPLLQAARLASIAVIVRVAPAGAMALGALIMTRWVSYYFYRLQSGTWANIRPNSMHLLFFAIGLAMLGIGVGLQAAFTWATAALVAWSLFRARKELVLLFRNARRLDRPRAK